MVADFLFYISAAYLIYIVLGFLFSNSLLRVNERWYTTVCVCVCVSLNALNFLIYLLGSVLSLNFDFKSIFYSYRFKI